MDRLALGPFPDAFGFETGRRLDDTDPLRDYRQRFVIEDPDLIYLDGNSLGRMPRVTAEHLVDVIEREWGRDLIESWGERWWRLARDTGAEIASVIGADPDSVVVADSTSVCLYKLAVGALRLRPGRNRIVTDAPNFPTDIHVLNAAANSAGGREVTMVPAGADGYPDENGIVAALDEQVALLSLSHVAFKSGYLYDLEHLTAAAHAAGTLVLWDLSHSAGVVPMELGTVDLAVGCTYKYLNGGPGSPAFLYVNPVLDMENPLTGWWGHRSPFAFDLTYSPAASIDQFQTGTSPILSLTAIGPGISILKEAGIDAIRAKSVALSSYLIDIADEVLSPHGFDLASPRSSAQRGSHVSLTHSDAWRVTRAMRDLGRVVPDFREPDNIRLALAPLYTSFEDVHSAVHRMANLVAAGAHERYSGHRSPVT